MAILPEGHAHATVVRDGRSGTRGGGLQSGTARVLFSLAAPGLTFLEDPEVQPDEMVDVGGPGIRDLELADVTGDGQNDLVALRTDGTIAVRPGVAAPPPGPYFEPAVLYETPVSPDGGTDQQAMAVGDVTCDGVPDVVVTAPAAGAVVVLHGDGTGAFPGRSILPMASGAWDVALGDLDEDGQLDLVTANVAASFSVRLTSCGGAFTDADTYPLIGGDPTPEAESPKMALGAVCPGHPGHLAVVAAIAPGSIFVTCGDGTGNFAEILEPHGEQVGDLEYDYWWTLNEVVEGQFVHARAVWPSTNRIYMLHRRTYGVPQLERLELNDALLTQPSESGTTILADLRGGGSFDDMALVARQASDGRWWQAVYVGAPGVGVVR